jgi:signal transduction histidine kinase
MKIKDRLALYFTLASTLMLLIVLFATYLVFAKFMESDFFDRLGDRTRVTANLYLEADEMAPDALRLTRNQYLEKLNSEYIRIYDANNEAVFIDEYGSTWDNQTIENIRSAGRVQFKNGLNQVVGIFYRDNQGEFVIIASAVDQSTIYRLEKLKTVMFFIFITIFIVLLLSARSIANRILRPLDIFIDEVKQIKSSNLDFRVQEGSNKDEISLLAANFNKLMAHLEQAFVLQKTFIANASHELRTPVTSMMIGAEIALSKERTAEEYKNALHSILEDAEKMDEIITGLLRLAHTDVEYGSASLENVSLTGLLRSIQLEYQRAGNPSELALEFKSLLEEDFILSANPALLKIAINNIIANGFKFSNYKAVQCIFEVDAMGTTIRIKDGGPGIAPADVPSIFDPFYSAQVRQNQHGTGMGLFMAKKIINLFNGTLVLEETGAEGSTFKIHFPRL